RFIRSADDRRCLAHTSAVGRIRYADGSNAHLVVLKIGLTSTSSAEVRTLRDRWRRFPNHGTGDQFYTSELFDAYRALGYDTTKLAIDSEEVDKVLRGLAWRTGAGGP